MTVKFLYIPEYVVVYFLLMHEIYKMQKIKKNKIQSHTIHKITKIFSLGNPYERKPIQKVRRLYSLFFGMEIMKIKRRRNSVWIYLRPVAY
jgi:DNA modification methylase